MNAIKSLLVDNSVVLLSVKHKFGRDYFLSVTLEGRVTFVHICFVVLRVRESPGPLKVLVKLPRSVLILLALPLVSLLQCVLRLLNWHFVPERD